MKYGLTNTHQWADKSRMTREGGFAAIVSMLVILAVTIIVGTTVALSSIGNAQMALGGSKADSVRVLAESCMEEVLLKINLTASVPSSIITPDGTCSVTTDSQVGSTYTVSVTATQNNRTKKITTTATRTTLVGITSWQEQN